MSLLGWLFGRKKQSAGDRAVSDFLRAWNAGGAGDRITYDHWGKATSSSINEDLAACLANLRDRSRYERQNNGMLEGMADTFANDLIGADGPKLQISASQESSAEKLENDFRRWRGRCSACGQLSLGEILRQDALSLFDNGEWFNQVIHADDAPMGTVALRLHPVPARLIESPTDKTGDPNVTLGVETNDVGRPLRYYARKSDLIGLDHTTIDARNMFHFFVAKEAGQRRGVPVLASVLNVLAQLRDYEADVMQAARMAAMLAVILQRKNPDGTPEITLNGSHEIERGMMTAVPDGYEASQIDPQQPSTMYTDFRSAKLQEIGRAINMPLMILGMDSSKHNYSSARFDGQQYDRGLLTWQKAIEHRQLDPIVEAFIRESQLLGRVPSTIRSIDWQWVWPSRPHVDPKKELEAIEGRIKAGLGSMTEGAAEFGTDLERMRELRAREGLPKEPLWLLEYREKAKQHNTTPTSDEEGDDDGD